MAQIIRIENLAKELQSTKEEANQSFETLKRDLGRTVHSLEEDKKQLQEENQTLMGRLAASEAEAERLQGENQTLRGSLNDVHRVNQTLQGRLYGSQRKNQTLQERLDGSQRENQTLQGS